MSRAGFIVKAAKAAIVRAYPVPNNNLVGNEGDSRSDNNTEVATTAATKRVTGYGWQGWAQVFSDAIAKYTANYGLNTDTIQGNEERLHAAGTSPSSGGTAPGDPRRGWMLDYEPGLSIAYEDVLIGVNNGGESAAVSCARFDTLFMKKIDAGKILNLMNGLPNNNSFGQGAAILAQKDYLDVWPANSVLMTAAQKAFYGARVIHTNTYDACAVSPRSYMWKDGLNQDDLHPKSLGGRVIGELVGATRRAFFLANGYPVRNTLPTLASQGLLSNGLQNGSVAITATNGETTGNGPNQNGDGQGGLCVTGNLPTGWSITRSSALRTLLNAASFPVGSQLSVLSAKSTIVGYDGQTYPYWTITVTGQVGALNSNYALSMTGDNFVQYQNLGNFNSGKSVADGDELYPLGRMKLLDGHTGIFGIAPITLASATGFADSGSALLTGSIVTNPVQVWDGMAGFDKAVLGQPTKLPVGFTTNGRSPTDSATLGCRVEIVIAGGKPINFTFGISQFILDKNR